MATYLLRDIDAAFWRRVKSKAAHCGISVRALLMRLLAEWLREE